MNDRIVETKQDARQGETRQPMGKVLLISLALIVVAFVIIYVVFAA